MNAMMECIALAGSIVCAPAQPMHGEPPRVEPDAYVLFLDGCMRQKVKDFAEGMRSRGASDDVIERHVSRLLSSPVHDDWLKQCRESYDRQNLR